MQEGPFAIKSCKLQCGRKTPIYLLLQFLPTRLCHLLVSLLECSFTNLLPLAVQTPVLERESNFPSNRNKNYNKIMQFHSDFMDFAWNYFVLNWCSGGYNSGLIIVGQFYIIHFTRAEILKLNSIQKP